MNIENLKGWVGKEKDAVAERGLDRKYVHKNDERNALVAEIASVDDEKNVFLSQAYVDLQHPFFFEHEVDHIPGLFIIEFARQASMAASHLFLDIPLSSVFIMERLDSNFISIPEKTHSLFAVMERRDICLKKGRVASQVWQTKIVQMGRTVAVLEGDQKILSEKVFSRLRA